MCRSTAPICLDIKLRRIDALDEKTQVAEHTIRAVGLEGDETGWKRGVEGKRKMRMRIILQRKVSSITELAGIKIHSRFLFPIPFPYSLCNTFSLSLFSLSLSFALSLSLSLFLSFSSFLLLLVSLSLSLSLTHSLSPSISPSLLFLLSPHLPHSSHSQHRR